MGFFSNLFKKKDRTPALPDTVRQALDRMVSILNDDDKQNALMPVHLQSILLQGAAIDEINGGEGPFGKNPCNPIPVNGPLGEITYLSRLLTKSEGQPLFFTALEFGKTLMSTRWSPGTGLSGIYCILTITIREKHVKSLKIILLLKELRELREQISMFPHFRRV